MLDELLDEFLTEKKLYGFEGERGVKNLNVVAEALGYKEERFALGSPLELFLADNSGAIEAVLNWIRENMFQEWAENLEAHLPEKEEESAE